MSGARATKRAQAQQRGLTDDVLTLQAPARNVRVYLAEALDRLVGADPGLTQLRTAVQAVLGIVVAVGLVDAFVHLTGALQLPSSAGSSTVVAAHNRAALLVLMLVAGMIAMMAGFTVTDPTARAQVVTTVLLPVPMLVSMVLGLTLSSYRVPSLIFLVVAMAAAVYARRWGPRGVAGGLVAFNGAFLGFFLHAEIGVRQIGWLAADLGLGVLASLAVRFVVLRPDPVRTLQRMRGSWEARARRLLGLSLGALSLDPLGLDPVSSDPLGVYPAGMDAPDARSVQGAQERLRRQVVRLNESTLMIDAQLAQSVPRSAATEAARLFDAELALTNCARFASALASADPAVRERARVGIGAVLDQPASAQGWTAVAAAAQELRAGGGSTPRTSLLARRLASSIEGYAAARQQLSGTITDGEQGRAADDFTPAVVLRGGYLPGSLPVSSAASTTPGRGWWLNRVALAPYVRASIQAGVAGTIAVVVGDIVSGPRLYWAVLAAFLAFMATTNSGEQVRKALFRVAGTAIGIVVGDLLVHLTGADVWSSLAIVLVALFFGIYLIRVNYTFMVVGVTVTMSQLYKQLGEFSWHLMLLRLGETAIGVGAVVATVLVIVPLRPQRVLTAGVLLWFQALAAVLDGALDDLTTGRRVPLRPAIRELDAAYAALEATTTPLRRTTFGRNSDQLSEIRIVSAAARGYARSLGATVEAVTEPAVAQLIPAAIQFRASTDAIEHRIETGENATYVRASALVEQCLQSLVAPSRELRVALRELTVLDGALARLAAALHMDVVDLDVHHDDPDGVPAGSGNR